MPPMIYILCGDATYNRGDRGNLLAQIELLKNRFPEASIVADSYRPQVDQGWYDVRMIRRGRFLTFEQIRYLRKARVIVWGGGALLADNASRIKIPYWFLVIGFLKWVLRKPVMAWAQGLVIATPLGTVLGRMVLNAVDLVTVRDRCSLEILRRIGVNHTRHFMTADPAVLVRASSPEAGRRVLEAEGIRINGRPLFAVANTFCPFHYNAQDILPYMIAEPLGLRKERGRQRIEPLKRGLARVIDLMIEKYDCQVLLIPTYPAPWENDIEHFRDLVGMAKRKDRICLLKGDCYSPQEYLALWHHLQFVLTIPMHHGIFSTAMGVPCVQLYYESKGLDFFTEIDAADCTLNVEILYQPDGPERVMDVVCHALSHKETLLAKTLPQFESLRVLARKNADYLAGLMEGRQPMGEK